MRRFRFTLEPALRLRRSLEEQAQVLLAERQRELQREQVRLEELQLDRQRHEQVRASLQHSALDVQALIEADWYGRALERALAGQQERVDAAGAAVEEAREGLHQRRLEREALERLREHRFQVHQQAMLHAEQQALDEAAVLRWQRRRE